MPKFERFFPDTFCPLTKGQCFEGCQWCYLGLEITDDGIFEKPECALNMIAEAVSGVELYGES